MTIIWEQYIVLDVIKKGRDKMRVIRQRMNILQLLGTIFDLLLFICVKLNMEEKQVRTVLDKHDIAYTEE